MARTIVITGVSRGLGRAMALGFAEGGHKILGCARSLERLDRLRRDLGPPHDLRPVDLAGGSVDSWAKELLAEHGPPDLLINNAALINVPRDLWEVPEEEFDALVRVNVTGVFRVVRAFVPAMVRRGSGVVVNFSSGWGRSTSAGVAPYCASKFAVEGMTGALAQELPPGLAAVALNPGIIDTDMLRSAWGEGAAAHPGPREWAARAVPFLLSLGTAHNGRSLDLP